MKPSSARWPKLALGFVALAFCAAPVPGDVGGCGQTAQELDAIIFFASKQELDCEKCGDCALASAACQRACGEELVQRDFPEDCVPLVHDGEVCLRALQDASCEESGRFLADVAPETPTECNFCPVRGSR